MDAVSFVKVFLEKMTIGQLRAYVRSKGAERGIFPTKKGNDAMDAFTHGFSSAMMAYWFSDATAEKLGGWVEGLRSDNPELERAMDLYNNAVGRRVTAQSRYNIDLASVPDRNDVIADLVKGCLERGELIASLSDPRLSGVSLDFRAGFLSAENTGKYIWRTARDGKVRFEHAVREGQLFSWANPPAGGNPSEAYGCRCWVEPYQENEKTGAAALF